jgi:4-hydroxy-3-methylbut-2-enyl diphosphate reductase
MSRVQTEIESHYKSGLVERIRGEGGVFQQGRTIIRLAKQFGFCYGVERAIDLAYATRKVFPDRRISLLGEIIHKSEVNDQPLPQGIHLAASVRRGNRRTGFSDVVIIPAFGARISTVESIKRRACQMSIRRAAM